MLRKLSAAAVCALLLALFVYRMPEGAGFWAGAAMCLLFALCAARICLRGKIGGGKLKKPGGVPYKKILLFMLATRALIYIAAYLFWALRNGWGAGFFDSLRTVWIRSDANSYLGISERWYVTEGDPRFHIVFFPLYPMVMAAFNLVTRSSFASALIVSNLCAFAGAAGVYRLAALDMTPQGAFRAVKYAYILPAAFFYAAPMTEALFFLLCVYSVYCIRREKWLLGCVLGALAGFTRSVGGLLAVYAGVEWLAQLRRAPVKVSVKRALCICVIPLGLIAYLYINYAVTGDPFTFMKYQREHWSQGFGLFFKTAATQLRQLIYAVENKNTGLIFGLWAPNLLASLVSLGIMLCAAKKLRASYSVFFLVYFAVACGATWLLSSPRYLCAAFPLPLALAELTEDPRADVAATALCGVLLALYLAMFANGQYVY